MSEPYKIEDLLNAKPIDRPDRANIKWGRRRKKFKVKWNVHSQKGSTLPQKKIHPGTKQARIRLEYNGRLIDFCEKCGSDSRVTIHHINRNPYDNQLENLKILCWNCHRLEHNEFEEQGIIDEEANVPFEDPKFV